jgi:hypothetical protein
MSSISGNGATQSVFLQMSGASMQYSVGATPGAWTTISSWPVTINNSNPGSFSILNVKATQPLTISSSTGGTSGYFIAGTTYITFDGSGNTITIDTITSYPGFIQNGTPMFGVGGYGKANVIVKNFTTTISGASTLSTQAGWLCQFYFGNGVSGTLVTNCTNNGEINVASGGGIVGTRFGTNTSSAGAATISYCTNNGNFSTTDVGGIAGSSIGVGAVQNAVTISYCTNNANLNNACGGIVGSTAGDAGGYVTITYCTNNGNIPFNEAGGIAGQYLKNGSISYCTNTGNISGVRSGGIVGSNVGYFVTSNALSITNCFNTGTITGVFAGGITGQYFGYDYNGIITISNCYSTGAIGTGTTGNNGGILGSNPGYNSGANTATINITNCYSTGAVAASCGGIVGGKDASVYNHAPTLNITNCYSSGVLTGTGAGMVAVAYPFSVTPVSSYTANGSWTDAAANAALTGTPTSLTSGNPGATWAKVVAGTTGNPYVLASYNAALYSPSSASSALNYNTSAGLYTDSSYSLVYSSQAGNTATIRVFAYKGTSPNYYSYNFNTFAFTNTTGIGGTIGSRINTSTGVLTIGAPALITANGSTQYVGLRMDTSGNNTIQYSTDQSTWSTLDGSFNWPVTINNSNPGSSSILNVKATQPLRISSSTGGTSGYFIAGTTYITFDGSGNTITIDTITSYPGFIQNGTVSVNGNSNIAVQNFTTTISGGSTLLAEAGWLCQSYFSKGVAGNTITSCTNNGEINNSNCGGIVGFRCNNSNNSISITNCTNNGAISGINAGGIVGSDLTGLNSIVTGCTNTGAISGQGAGGIVGNSCGKFNGYFATITSCTNTGTISAFGAGGIAGTTCGGDSGTCNITSCTNTGIISGISAGGIVGSDACMFKGTCNITKCISTGNITATGSGGIAGQRFAYDTSTNNIISNCYSIGNISGTNAGGIVGANVGNNDASFGGGFIPVVDISNCYSLGTIATSCGGICGGQSLAYTNKATINITNSYSYGALSGTGQGLVAASLTSTYINLTTTNTYVAAGSWTDAAANANLTGTPTSLTSGNPGATWATIATNTPYILSAFNAALYSPSSASAEYGYTTSAGLFTPGYTYQILQNTQSGATATTQVVAYKGASPNYNSYNINTFAMTNNSGANPISASINASTGILSYTLAGAPCFLEGTKILCLKNNVEQYRPIETLRKGDLVKTIYNGYVPIYMIGTTSLYNPGNDYRVVNRLYKCPKENYPSLFEDLYITGCHSILVPSMTDDQWENTKAVNRNVFVTDNHFRLIACADEKALPLNKEGFMNIYHIGLEHHDYYMNYGIYANGLLVESCSIDCLIYSSMRILGEEDCTASQTMQLDNVFNKNTGLIETC